MRLTELYHHKSKSKSATILKESWYTLTESQQTYLGRWETDVWPLMEQYVKLCEAELTPAQIQQIFQNAEQVAASSGTGRTTLGKVGDAAQKAGAGAASAVKLTADVAKQINAKINELGKLAQQSGPVQGFDQKFEKLKADILAKNKDSNTVQGIQKISDWAKANPGKATLAVGILTTLAAFAGGPAGGAAAGLIFRSTKGLLQGDNLSTAVGKSLKTAAVGFLAGNVFNFLSDGMKDFFTSSTEADLKAASDALVNANVQNLTQAVEAKYGEAADLWNKAFPDGNYKVNVNVSGTGGSYFSGDVILTKAQALEYNQLIKAANESRDIFSEQGRQAMAKTYAFLEQVKATTDQSALATINDQGIEALNAIRAAGEAALEDPELKSQIAKLSGDAAKDRAIMKDIADLAAAAGQGAVQARPDKGKSATESIIFKPTQIETNIEWCDETPAVVLIEGPLDAIGGALKKGAAAAGGAIKTGMASAGKAGKELGSDITLKKLNAAWKSMGSPTDTGSIMNILQNVGMDGDQVSQVAQAAGVDQAMVPPKLQQLVDQIKQAGPEMLAQVIGVLTGKTPAAIPAAKPVGQEPVPQQTASGKLTPQQQAAKKAEIRGKRAAGKTAGTTASGFNKYTKDASSQRIVGAKPDGSPKIQQIKASKINTGNILSEILAANIATQKKKIAEKQAATPAAKPRVRISEIYKTLLEYNRQLTIDNWEDKVSDVTKTDQSSTNIKKESWVAYLEQADPTPTKSYMKWIIREYIAGNFMMEDVPLLHDVLATYHKFKPQLPAEQRDINRLSRHKVNGIYLQLTQPEEDTSQELDNNIPGVKTLYSGPLGHLLIPETHKASCKLGRGTSWCTATASPKHYDMYTRKGPLYVWLERMARGGDKYQFHFESHQYMDIKDQPITPTKMAELRNHPVVGKLFRMKEKEMLDYGDEGILEYLRKFPAFPKEYLNKQMIFKNKITAADVYYVNGKKHRDDGGPAVEHPNGHKEWQVNGELHREDGPAIIYSDGTEMWYRNDIQHREDGPAVEDTDGTKIWYLNGKRHRENGPAIIHPDGTQEWRVNGRQHRVDGPAIEHANGNKEWWVNDKRHREDGPAIEYTNGNKKWWLNGKQVTKREVMSKKNES